jgi:hypothetical protein
MGQEYDWEFHQAVDAPGGDLRQVSLTKDPGNRFVIFLEPSQVS